MTCVWHIYGQNHWFDLLSVSMMEGEKKGRKKGRKEEIKKGTKEWRKEGKKGITEMT